MQELSAGAAIDPSSNRSAEPARDYILKAGYGSGRSIRRSFARPADTITLQICAGCKELATKSEKSCRLEPGPPDSRSRAMLLDPLRRLF